MIAYLETFFAEKDLDLDMCWTLQDNQEKWHWIGPKVVIAHIGRAPHAEQEAIAGMIRKIDFANGDVNDYLKHLAGALING